MREQTQSQDKSPPADDDSSRHKATTGSWRKGLFLAAGIITVGLLTVVFLHSPVVQDPNSEKKTLEFRPKGKTISQLSPPKDPEFIDLNDMINSFNLDIPVLQPDERLLRLIGENSEKAELAANSLIKELGQKVTFAFAEANAYFLYWKGRLSRFSNTEEMREVMRKLDNQKRKLQGLLREWSGEVPEDAEIVPETLDGEPVYGMEMLDENGEPLQIYVNPDGVRMRLSNGQFLNKTYQPDEALKRINQ